MSLRILNTDNDKYFPFFLNQNKKYIQSKVQKEVPPSATIPDNPILFQKTNLVVQ